MSDDLIKNLQRIAEAMEASAAAMKLSKAPELWDHEQIAAWIHMDPDAVRDRITKQPGFPKPFAPSGTKQGKKLWFMADVVEWARLNISAA